MKLVTHRKRDVVEFVTARIDYPLTYENVIHEAIGGEDEDGRLRFGVVFHLFKPLLGGHDIEFNGAIAPGESVPRRAIAGSFLFAFWNLRAIRLSATVSKKNRKSRKALEALGFRREGAHRWGLGPGLDSLTYGMTYKQCRWLTDEEKQTISERIELTRRVAMSGTQAHHTSLSG